MSSSKSKSNISTLASYIKRGWQISKTASKPYKITMLVIALIIFSVNWSLGQVMFKSGDDLGPFIARSFIDTTFYLIICHFFIRPYLKLSFIQQRLSIKLCGKFLIYLVILSSIAFFIAISIGKIEYLNPQQFEKVQFVGEKGTVDANITGPFFFIIGISQTAVNLLIWAIFYIFWHANQAKKQLQKKMQQAQIQQLTNQLSPHFLFNTLNSIRALIFEDQNKAADTVTQLSELFRTHLQAHLRSASSLEEELEVSKRFLSIEGIRLEERLNVEINIDDDVKQQKLPTLTLLTLIENATKHGISPNAEPGYLNVEAKKVDKSSWRLIIVNSIGENNDPNGTKTGLANVKARIDLMFANTAKFDYLKEKEQFTVTMDLPYV